MTRSNETTRSTDLLVIGAGPVGMALAATTARYGMNVTILDAAEAPTPYSKAIGIHAITLESMHTLGLADRLLADGFPMRDYAVHDGGRRTMATSFRGLPTAYDFVLGLPQSRTEHHLHEDLKGQGVNVMWRHRLRTIRDRGALEDVHWPAVAEIERPDGSLLTVSAQYIVGADGGRSTTRDAVGIGFPGGSYGKAFLLGDVELDWTGPRHELQFHLSRHGYLLLIPMPCGMHRVIAQTDLKWEDFQKRDARPEARLEMLQHIIDQRGPGGIRAHSPHWLTAAPFYYRLASAARKDRVFLAGDAMHLVSPLGAQGLNTGFGDAFNLGWKLGWVHRGLASPSLLDSYGAERLALAERLISITSRTTRYITATQPWERLARQVATRVMNGSRAVQRELPALLSGIRQRYDASALTGNAPSSAWPAAGSRLPRARLMGRAGPVELTRLVHGREFTVLFILRRADKARLEALSRELMAIQGLSGLVRPIVIAREAATGFHDLRDALCLEDPYADLSGEIGEAHTATVLIRPDGFVAASSSTLGAGFITDFFAAGPWRKPLAEGGLRHVA